MCSLVLVIVSFACSSFANTNHCLDADWYPKATDEIRFFPVNPSGTDTVEFMIVGARGLSPISIDSVATSVTNNTITVDAKMEDLLGYATPGVYCYSASIGSIPAGTYAVTYLIESRGGNPNYMPPRIVATAALTIAPAPVPAVSPLGIFILIAATLFVALTRFSGKAIGESSGA